MYICTYMYIQNCIIQKSKVTWRVLIHELWKIICDMTLHRTICDMTLPYAKSLFYSITYKSEVMWHALSHELRYREDAT